VSDEIKAPRPNSFAAKIAEAKAKIAEEARQAAEEARAAVAEVPAENSVQPAISPTPALPPRPPMPTARTGTPAERLAAIKAAKALAEQADQPAKPEPSAAAGTAHVPDVPEVSAGELQLSQEDQALDADIAGMNIIDAYNKWIGKGHVEHTSQKDGIKVRCPDPTHPDNDPSAWLNQEKGLWHCPGCAVGGDIWDFAAWHFGYPVPGYKADAGMFRELREKIAGELGYKKYIVGSSTVLSRTPPTVEPDPPVEDPVEDEVVETPHAPLLGSNVVQLVLVEDEEYAEAVGAAVPSIDWRQLAPDGTFLEAWMRETTKDTCPEEYHFWTGLMALGFAAGRNRLLLDNPKVVPNIFICLTGPSGTGKSRAKGHLKRILAQALPFDYGDPLPQGVKIGSTPGSGEHLVDLFVHKIDDPSATGAPQKDWPIRVYTEFDEMASLVAKGARSGSSLKPQLMEVYDAPWSISAGSRGSGSAFALEPFGQVLTTTQNKSIRGVVSEKDDAAGFVNRWVFVTGPKKEQKAINLHIADYTEPSMKLKGVHLWASTPKDVTFTPDALEAFELFYKEVFAMKDKAEESTAIFNRIDLLLKKLILLLAINDRTELITTEHVARLKALYPYLTETYGVVKTAMASTESRDLEGRISGVVNRYYDKHKKAITKSYIRKFFKDVETEALEKIITNMVKFELLIMEEEASAGSRNRGRPATYRLLPGKAA
jgi:hypothetical protein